MKNDDLFVWGYTLIALCVASLLVLCIRDADDLFGAAVLVCLVAYVQWNYWRKD